MEAIKNELKQKPASQVFSAVSGPAKAKTVGELPRSQKQVYDLQCNSKMERDPVEDLVVYARHKEQKVVLRHEDMPLDLWVLGTDIMCHDLVRFSCSDSGSHPISIDPTFNMVVPKDKAIWRKPCLHWSNNDSSQKNFDTFKVLASTCVSNCKGLANAKGYITDGEEELVRAWKSELPKATHLRCIRHFEGNCKQKLREIGIREAKSQKCFLNPVFGVPGKIGGIVDLERSEGTNSGYKRTNGQ
ncbi:hypothetical protein OS493_029023 [Desmophyllum pertusum]|uniref:MULE transposase domain-containing protein n=1 Tax=Desmophyllum pertusum TaxID=174260 RepID=A0A9X0CIU1_9CNID|nr:hypothetical protein OS493_029023 [Desmophyllum pertusum]